MHLVLLPAGPYACADTELLNTILLRTMSTYGTNQRVE